MEIRTLYRYERSGGGVTVSPVAPEKGVPYTEMYRVIAGEGMLVTRDGVETYSVVDTDTRDGWYEVEDTSYIDAEPISRG